MGASDGSFNLHDLAKANFSYERLSMNELRARLYMEGKDYPEEATREQLAALLEKG